MAVADNLACVKSCRKLTEMPRTVSLERVMVAEDCMSCYASVMAQPRMLLGLVAMCTSRPFCRWDEALTRSPQLLNGVLMV